MIRLRLIWGVLQAEVNGTNLSLSGQAALTPLGWSYDGQGRVPSVSTKTVMTLWPEMLNTKSRRWFGRNVRNGTLKNLTVDLRQTVGTAALLASSFQFEKAGCEIHAAYAGDFGGYRLRCFRA